MFSRVLTLRKDSRHNRCTNTSWRTCFHCRVIILVKSSWCLQAPSSNEVLYILSHVTTFKTTESTSFSFVRKQTNTTWFTGKTNVFQANKMHEFKCNKTDHKTDFLLGANCYLFRHQGDLFRDFIDNKGS